MAFRQNDAQKLSIPGLLSQLQMQSSTDRLTNQLNALAEDHLAKMDYERQALNLPQTARSTFLMVFSPDGKHIGSTHGDHKIYISDVKSAKVIRTLEGHPRTPWCLAFHPVYSDLIASGCLAGHVRVWDLRSGAFEHWHCSEQAISSICFHPNQDLLCIATHNRLHFWNWRKGQNGLVFTLTTGQLRQKVIYARFDCTGRRLVTGISNINQTYKSLAGLGLFGGITFPDGSFTASIQHVHQSPDHRQRSSASSVSSSSGSSLLQTHHHSTGSQPLSLNVSSSSSSSSIDSTQSSSDSASEDESSFADFGNSLTTGESIFSQSQSNLLQSEAISSLTSSLRNESSPNNITTTTTTTSANNNDGSNGRNFSITYRGSSLFTRLLRIVRRLEELDEPQRNPESRRLPTENLPFTPRSADIDEYSLIVETSNMVEGLIERYRINSSSPSSERAAFTHSNAPSQGATFFEGMGSSRADLLNSRSSIPQSPLLSHSSSGHPFIDYTRTFNRLSQLCHRLFNLVQNFYAPHLSQRMDSSLVSSSASSSIDSTLESLHPTLNPSAYSLTIRPLNDESPRYSYIVSLISRIQEWLQNDNQTEPFLSDQEMQQLRTHATEVIERLTNVTGIRERLSSLRTQIYELFERILLGDDLDEQRNYLLHGLLLVLMCINLTKRMQRIYVADLRITQLTQLSFLNNHLAANLVSPNSAGNGNINSLATDLQRDQSQAQTRSRKRPSDSSQSSSPKRFTKDITQASTSSSPSPLSSSSTDAASVINQQNLSDSMNNPIASTSSGLPSRILAKSRTLLSNVLSASSSSTPLPSSDLLRAGTPARISEMSPVEDITTAILNESNSFDSEQNSRSLFGGGNDSLPSTPTQSNRLFDLNQLSNLDHQPMPNGNRFYSTTSPHRYQASNNQPVNAGIDSPSGLNGGSWASYADFTLLGGADQNFNYRLQCWDFDGDRLPDLEDNRANLVVSRCRIQNDSSIDLSASGDLLACLVPVDGGSSGMNLCIYSLRRSSFAQCVYSWNFPSNAISVSLSQSGRFVLVGLSSPRVLSSYLTPPTDENLTIAQVFELRGEKTIFNQSWLNAQDAGSVGGGGVGSGKCGNSYHSKNSFEKDGQTGKSRSSSIAFIRQKALKKVRAIQVPRGGEVFSINSIRWLPFSGDGFIYGTNKGQLIICKPKCAEPIMPAHASRYMHLIQVIESLQRASTTGPYRQASSQSIGTQTTATLHSSSNNGARASSSSSSSTTPSSSSASSTSPPSTSSVL